MQGTSFQTSRRLSIPTLNSGQISPPALLPMCAHSTLHPPCTQAQSFMAEVPFSRFHLNGYELLSFQAFAEGLIILTCVIAEMPPLVSCSGPAIL